MWSRSGSPGTLAAAVVVLAPALATAVPGIANRGGELWRELERVDGESDAIAGAKLRLRTLRLVPRWPARGESLSADDGSLAPLWSAVEDAASAVVAAQDLARQAGRRKTAASLGKWAQLLRQAQSSFDLTLAYESLREVLDQYEVAVLRDRARLRRTLERVSEPIFRTHGDNYFTYQFGGPSDRRIKFRLGIRTDLASWGDEDARSVTFAFSQRSFWDLFDFAASAPFIESNYRPELFLSWRPDRLRTNREFAAGVLHESNGLGETTSADLTGDSRSWNAVFGRARWWRPVLAGWRGESWLGDLGMEFDLMVWAPKFGVSSDALAKDLGDFAARVALEGVIADSVRYGALRLLVSFTEHSLELGADYPLRSLSYGYVRPKLVGRWFRGRPERLIHHAKRVSHGYVGIGFDSD